MKRALLVLVAACGPPPEPQTAQTAQTVPPLPPALPPFDPTTAGQVVTTQTGFAFDGGSVELVTRRDGDHVYEVARNHYMVPAVIAWQFSAFDNLAPVTPYFGVTVLPAAHAPGGDGPPVVLMSFVIEDMHRAFRREVYYHARLGDPTARPAPYAYRLPYRKKQTFSVLQGFHGAFSHRGSNEFAVDFDCPAATHVLAARPGVVVAANAAAQGAGTTSEYLEYARTNFVFVLHDDGTIGEYMHLAPSGIEVRPGQRVERGSELALSGNTGFSSTPHLHFQVMTAAEDGVSARSFPIELQVGPDRVEAPVQGRSYPSWE